MHQFIDPNFHPTNRQKDEYEAAVQMAVKEYARLMLMAKKMSDAYVDPGTGSEDGDVVRHGANHLYINQARKYFVQAAQGLKLFFHDRDYPDYINYKLGFIADRFLNEDEFQERYSHCAELAAKWEREKGFALPEL